MSVEKLMEVMTLDEAKNVVIPFGSNSGKTMGQICIDSPKSINWYVDSYRGKNNILRAAAQLLLNTAG